jgi:branched-chain amino acid transport system substrate-binding protein
VNLEKSCNLLQTNTKILNIYADVLFKSRNYEKAIETILKSIELPPEDAHLKDTAARIKSLSPDAVFLSTIPPQGANLSRRLREIGYKGDFFGGIQEFRKDALINSKGALKDAWFVSGDDSKADNFYKEYKNKFGDDARDYSRFAVYAYDSLMILRQAIDYGDVISFMKNIKDYDGVSGVFSYDGNNGYTFPVKVNILE